MKYTIINSDNIVPGRLYKFGKGIVLYLGCDRRGHAFLMPKGNLGAISPLCFLEEIEKQK